VSDEWKSNSSINDIDYNHLTVNHSENFGNPVNRVNTQTIECLWSILKFKILRKMRGTNENLLTRHLIKCWYCSIKNRNNLFMYFLEDIKKVYVS
jgi:hypothetical protein